MTDDKRAEDKDRTIRTQPVKAVVERWFSDEKDGSEPPKVKKNKHAK